MKRSRVPSRIHLVRQPYEGDWIVQGYYTRFRWVSDNLGGGEWVAEWVDLGGGETRRAAALRALRVVVR